MEEECTIVGEVGKKDFGSPPSKKLKQSRLPFAPLDSKTPQKSSSPNNQKKRKLSGSELSQNSPKTPRSENNSMSETPVSDRKLQTPKSVGSATKDKSKQRVTPSESTKKRGRGRPPKSEKEKEENKKSKQASYEMTSDDEVSSSVDDDVDVPEAKKKPTEKTRKLLSAFMSKEPTQQAEVTTSTDDAEKSTMEQEDKENKDCTSEDESGRGEIEISSKDDSPVEEEAMEATSRVAEAREGEDKPVESTPKVGGTDKEEGKKDNKKSSPLINMLKAKKNSSDAKKEKAVKEKAAEEVEEKSGKEKETDNELEKEGKMEEKATEIKKVSTAKKSKARVKKSEGKEKGKVANKSEKKKETEEKKSEEEKEKTESKEASSEIKQVVEEAKKKEEVKSKEETASGGKDLEKTEETLKEKDQKVETESDSKKEKSNKEEVQIEDKTEENEENDTGEAKKKSDDGNTDSDSSKEEDKEDEDRNESKEEMEVDLDVSGSSKSEGTGSANTSPVMSSKASDTLEVPKSSAPKTPVSVDKAKKLTPKQLAKEAERQQKREERERLRKEREKKKQEELAEKEKLKKQKEEERLKAKEEKEKAKEEQKRKRQEEMEAKKMKKEEEQQLKEVERMIREEEARLAQEEKQKQKDKLKNKFASFFVAKKRDPEEAEEKSSNGNFKEFRVKEDMQLAPLVRSNFTEERRESLIEHLTKQMVKASETYVNVLKTGSYNPSKSHRTWPFENKKEEGDDDIEIIDEDEGMDAGDSMVQETASDLNSKTVKAKLLKFCENRRPAYWGTWSKKSKSICARRPFARDNIFNYEYDSDEDWEEEETGESLSDSEGEEKEEEEGDQYEVDNDFFVPHGYLSDDEGKSDQEEEDNGQEEDNGSKHKEQLKQKQAEFEEEMKKKTKHLKPRVIGSLWMADANNNPAFNQLLKILNPHKAVTLGTTLPIGTRHGGIIPKDTKEQKDDEDGSAEDKGNAKKFCKTFPEEAVPALIKLVHGNRNGKVFLSREFSDFWRRLQAGELDEEHLQGVPMISSPIHANMFLARKKVESKIQELGHWRKCPEEGPYNKVMMWYVSKQVREEHGVGDLTVPNSWNFINKPKEKREVNFEDPDTVEDSNKSSKAGKLTPITAFTKKLPSTPSSANTSPTSIQATTPQTLKSNEGSPSSASPAPVTPSRSAENLSCSTAETPSGKSGTPGQPKKKVTLFSVPRNQEITDAQKASFVSFFKKNAEKSPVPTKSESLKDKTSEKTSQPDTKKDDDDVQCITLE
ncbi:chromatin assembly factor 1 subunit A-B-like [Penaeus japonicus]|uniref:chromatin assembly factor 1 subunit A-B-like n=1 Tax=Penaeus japonicus TaxID=27405 RepID=UPI001C70C11E|nr:chromatin assembly factor 1 subunit A-B-like [Penaeus japonicus]